MKISTRSEYGIRVLLALARAEDDEPLSLTSVAKPSASPTPTWSSSSPTCAAPDW